MDRKEYVEALKVERAALNNRPDSPGRQRHIKAVEAELAKYEEKPKTRRRETAKKD